MIIFLESIITNGMFLNLGWNGLCIYTPLNYQKKQDQAGIRAPSRSLALQI